MKNRLTQEELQAVVEATAPDADDSENYDVYYRLAVIDPASREFEAPHYDRIKIYESNDIPHNRTLISLVGAVLLNQTKALVLIKSTADGRDLTVFEYGYDDLVDKMTPMVRGASIRKQIVKALYGTKR